MSNPHNTRAHAKLSASGSATWLNCPGSVQAQERYKSSSSWYADEGTMAHEIADKAMKERKDAIEYLSELASGELFINEQYGSVNKYLKYVHSKDDPKTYFTGMCNNVQEYLDYVRAFETKNTVLYTEERVNFSNVVPEGFGTMDAAVLDYDTGTCHIFDLKYGQGVAVSAYENTQAQLYAIGLYNELSFLGVIKSFKLHICQPRKNNWSDWEISVKNLIEFSRWVKERADMACTKDAPRIPGEKQCQWCDAKADCKALKDFTEKVISTEFDNLDELDPKDLSVLSEQDKKIILDNKKLIESFLKAVESDIYKTIDEGGKFNGYKLVHGKSNRVWTDDAEAWLAGEIGEDEAYTKKLIGITAAGKLLGKKKKEIDDYTFKPDGKPTLVPDSDGRPAIVQADVTDDFEEL